MSSIEFLNNIKHKNLKILTDKSFQHAKHHHMSYLLVNEFPKACLNFPIVFVKDSETGEFRSVALFGLEAGENVFYGEKQWNTTYIPADIKRSPFLMSQNENSSGEWAVCVDTVSPALSCDKGESLFDKEGNPTKILLNVQEFLTDYIERDNITKIFSRVLSEKELLKSSSIEMVNNKGEKSRLNGLYSVDENKLKGLSDEDYLELKRKGYIGPIYSHLTSLGQIERVMILRSLG